MAYVTVIKHFYRLNAEGKQQMAQGRTPLAWQLRAGGHWLWEDPSLKGIELSGR